MNIANQSENTRNLIAVLASLGSVQNLSHFGSCDGGSMGLKFHLV